MFAAILGPVAGLAKTWIEGKQKKAQLKSQVELTKLEARWHLGRKSNVCK